MLGDIERNQQTLIPSHDAPPEPPPDLPMPKFDPSRLPKLPKRSSR